MQPSFGVTHLATRESAREMYNVALAAMDGCEGDPSQYYDYRLAPPPIARV